MSLDEYNQLLAKCQAVIERFKLFIEPQDLAHDFILARLEGDRSATRLTGFICPYLKELDNGLVLIRPNIVTIELCQ